MLAIINSIDRRHFSTSFGDNAVLAAAKDDMDIRRSHGWLELG